jgi:hypothetical protein
MGTASEEIALVEAEGLPALRRTQTVRSEQLGDGKSETVVFRDGFLPYSHRDVTEDYTLSVACRGTGVTGRRKLASGETVMIKTEVAAPVFDAHSVEMVLRVLPLAEDYAAEIPVFHAGRAAEMLVTGQVFGHETLISSSAQVDAWKVRTDWDGVTQYYWIGVESRAFLRQFSELSDSLQLTFVR